MSFSWNVLPFPPTIPLPGEAAPTSSAKKATQGPPTSSPAGQRPLTGKFRETAAGGQEAPVGRQESGICTTKLSYRERWQHRDLHPRGSDKAMRTLPEPHRVDTQYTPFTQQMYGCPHKGKWVSPHLDILFHYAQCTLKINRAGTLMEHVPFPNAHLSPDWFSYL